LCDCPAIFCEQHVPLPAPAAQSEPLEFQVHAGKPLNHSTGASISLTNQGVNGGRGRIRTSVARKERQIYSLLVLATHPPVPKNFICRANCLSQKLLALESRTRGAKTQNGLVSKDTSPSIFLLRIRSASFPRETLLVELAEGIEPPTL
jgi:hypothetical protein